MNEVKHVSLGFSLRMLAISIFDMCLFPFKRMLIDELKMSIRNNPYGTKMLSFP